MPAMSESAPGSVMPMTPSVPRRSREDNAPAPTASVAVLGEGAAQGGGYGGLDGVADVGGLFDTRGLPDGIRKETNRRELARRVKAPARPRRTTVPPELRHLALDDVDGEPTA